MAGARGAEDAPTTISDEDIDPLVRDPAVQAWIEDHLQDLRQDVFGQRILYTTLATIFVVGLVVYVVGYLLRSAATTEPFGLLADLLYTLGFALWTAAVVVVLIEIIPEAKRRQLKRMLESYEAVRRDTAPRKGRRRSKSGTTVRKDL